jgi:type III pantothenate kinase
MAGKYGIVHSILLADIGNSYFHIYNGLTVEHLNYDDAIQKYKDTPLKYISVNQKIEAKIGHIKIWENLSSSMVIEGQYDTMGVDRKALCLSHSEGVFIDAGSAITVDVVAKGKYVGGFILPGLKAYINSYKAISPILDVALNRELSLDSLPGTTKDGISYGIIASIKALIDKHSDGKKLYFTGGDGEFLSSFFEDAMYDEMLVFNGMQQAIINKG